MSTQTTNRFVQDLKANEKLRSAVKQKGFVEAATAAGYDITATDVQRMMKAEIMEDIPSTELPSEKAMSGMSNGPCSPSCGGC